MFDDGANAGALVDEVEDEDEDEDGGGEWGHRGVVRVTVPSRHACLAKLVAMMSKVAKHRRVVRRLKVVVVATESRVAKGAVGGTVISTAMKRIVHKPMLAGFRKWLKVCTMFDLTKGADGSKVWKEKSAERNKHKAEAAQQVNALTSPHPTPPHLTSPHLTSPKLKC